MSATRSLKIISKIKNSLHTDYILVAISEKSGYLTTRKVLGCLLGVIGVWYGITQYQRTGFEYERIYNSVISTSKIVVSLLGRLIVFTSIAFWFIMLVIVPPLFAMIMLSRYILLVTLIVTIYQIINCGWSCTESAVLFHLHLSAWFTFVPICYRVVKNYLY